MAEKVPPIVCPFCGVTTDVPHENQEGCIEALHVEIARMRELLEYVKVPGSEAPRDGHED
jgi:hypothetical protein